MTGWFDGTAGVGTVPPDATMILGHRFVAAPAAPPEPVPAPAPGFTSRQLRDVMGQFATGVTVVTMPGVDGPSAVTVNSFTSLSLDPALAMVCLRTRSRGAADLRAAARFAVNILGAGQGDLCALFASSDRPSGHQAFAAFPHRTGRTGAPLLDGTVGHVECVLESQVPVGDHTLFVGAVLAVETGSADGPLVFHGGRYFTT
ncbi:flavin reductase family protein [Saccharothrix sp. NRRL B-16314]|uniref:flavin reductase family protein n=1 Tax=Saccharothrix sp. NRRL B-16314 TaxID=1463825 RepID=UPI00069110F3|nr:flavin reductase family protein [Saccharothrix sp. NRRL B-16314]